MMVYPTEVAIESLTAITEKTKDDAELNEQFGIALKAFKKILDILNSRREATPPAHTQDSLRNLASTLSANGKTDEVKRAIARTGARKLSEIDPAKYDSFAKELYEVLDTCMPS